MERSGCQQFNLKNLAESLKSLGMTNEFDFKKLSFALKSLFLPLLVHTVAYMTQMILHCSKLKYAKMSLYMKAFKLVMDLRKGIFSDGFS
jgi:hypothetical protein